MAFLPTNASQVQQFAVALYGIQVGSSTMAAVQADIAAAGGLSKALNGYYAASFGNSTTASVAASVAANLGLTGAAATDGAAYITAALNAAPASARGEVISNILNLFSTLSSNATYGAAATAWNTKVAAAVSYTGASDAAVVAGAAVTGSAFVLTKSSVSGVMDAVTGTAADDSFNGLADGMLETGDALSGGAGTDTVNARFTANSQTIAPTLTDIEEVYVQVDGANAKTFTFDATGVTGTVWNKNHDDNGDDDDTDEVVTFTNVANTAAAGVYGGQEYSDTTVTFKSTSGTADSGTVKFAGAKADTVTVAGIETLNLVANKVVTAASTTGSSTIDTLAASSAKTINVTGNASLKLSATDTAATLTVDASGMATGGSLNFAAESSTALTFTGSKGNDRVNIGAIAQLTAADTINGGDGTDTFATSDSGAAFTADERTLLSTRLTGFEKLEFTGTTSVAVDFTDLAVFDTVVFSGATTATAGTGASGGESGGNAGDNAHTITGIDTGDAIIISAAIIGGAGESITARTAAVDAGDGGDALVLTPELDNGSNSVTITFSADLTGGAGGSHDTNGATAGSGGDGGDAINASSFETVTLITAQNSTSTLTSLNIAGGAAGGGGSAADSGNAGSSVVVGTNGKIVVQGAIDLNLGTISGTNAQVDASAFTGDLTVVLEAGSNTFIGGSGDDVVTGLDGLDTYTLGAGIDRVNIGVEATTTASDAPANGTSFETITDFNKAEDVLNFLAADETAVTETIVTNATAVAGTAAINAEGIASFVTADDTLAERITAVEAAINAGGVAAEGQMAVFEFSGSTYVFVSNGNDTVEAGDVVVKLLGVTGITTTTFDDNGYLVLG